MDIPSSIDFRSIVVHTPLGSQLGFRQMNGSEGLSQLFDFDVELVADNYNLDLKSLLGKPLTIEMQTVSGSRYLNGHVTRCEMIGRENSVSRYYIYKATVRPWLWYLTQTSDNKIFQQKSVPDVIKEVLGEYGFPFDMKLTGSYRNWEYCVQYQETDFAFVSRLMEHEGIYYYFKHENDQHTLVMTDDIASHGPMSGYSDIPYYGPDRLGKPQEEFISMWEIAAQITPDGYATVDYDFTKPGASLDAVSKRPGGSQSGNLEMFEWQGGFQEPDHGEQYSRVRLQELQSMQEQNRGLSNSRGIAPGYIFNLKNHPRSAENKEYLVVSVNYRMSVSGYSSGTGLEDFYEESFIALPSSIQYRAPRVTPIPRTYGPQTARVVGPAGEEIWTDKYGRIKVQFHWDRYGKKNENSSCWVRVSSPWAGGGFGGLQLPRINDEVVVDFIGGCPDRPLVLGRVYNANNMPPVELPGCANQSGFRSQTVHGDPSMCNKMIFDDTGGSELFHTRAQKDMCNEVINDHNHTIGNNHCQKIGNNHDIEVGNNLQTIINAMEERLVKAEQRITINSNAIHNYDSNFDQTITGIENRITKAEQKITVNSNAMHNYDSNFNQTIKGIETKVTNAEQKITVNSQALHNYNTNLKQVINATHDVTVQANQNTNVLGLMKHEAGQYYSGIKGAKLNIVLGVQGTIVGGANFSVYPINAFLLGVSATASGFTASFHGGTINFIGKELKTKGQKTEIAAAENRLLAMENGVSVTRSRTAALARITRGVKMAQNGMQQDINGLKNNMSGLDNRVSGLENHA